jgi:hypothetical protein
MWIKDFIEDVKEMGTRTWGEGGGTV